MKKVDIVKFNTQEDAMEVLEFLKKHIDKYGFVTVFDWYDYVGLISPIESLRYGWDSHGDMVVYAYKDYWYIDMPDSKQLLD